MKHFFTLLGLLAITTTAYGQADTDILNIPDEWFKRKLLNNNNINTNGDWNITYGEARAYTGVLDVWNGGEQSTSIKDLTGIEAFINITGLTIVYNKVSQLDLSHNIHLETLHCRGNELTYLNVSKNTKLKILSCPANKLTSLDITNNTKLIELDISNNLLTNIDVSHAPDLEKIYSWEAQLTNLDISQNTKLKELLSKDNKLSHLDISKNIALTDLDVGKNELTNLDVSKNVLLKTLNVIYNQLSTLDLSKNPKLTHLDCRYNNLSQLNLANGQNSILESMTSWENPPLNCIQIDSGFYKYYWWSKDAHSYYLDNCNYPALSTQEKSTTPSIKILNPIKNDLIIKTEAKVERIEIYNTAGQLVKVLFKGNTNVQDLTKGTYLIKITTDQGVRTEKIIKI